MCCWLLPFFLRPLCTSIPAARNQDDRLAGIVVCAQDFKPSPHYCYTFYALIIVRKLFLLYTSLPHYHHLFRRLTFSSTNNGRFHLLRARLYPWSIRLTLQKR